MGIPFSLKISFALFFKLKNVFFLLPNPSSIRSKDISYKGSYYSIIIEDDVLIGSNVVILSGTKIGNGSIVSPGSVVSGIYPSYSILVGNPARISQNRKEN